MALSKIGTEAVEHISSSANAIFLTVDASEQITVASEGGAVTTSVQQGLAKAWLSMANDFAIDDSLNMASVTDAGTGKYSHAYTNNMSNATYTINAGGNSGALNTTFVWVEPTIFATSGAQASTGTSANGGTVALGDNGTVTTAHGDLA